MNCIGLRPYLAVITRTVARPTRRQQTVAQTIRSLAVWCVLALTAMSALCQQAIPAPTQLWPGMRYEELTITGEIPALVHIVEIALKTPGLRFAVTPADRSQGMEYTARLTSTYLEERHAQLAINAMYFLPFRGGKNGTGFYPHVGEPVNVSGAALSDGQTVSPVETDLDPRVDAMLCFRHAEGTIVDGQQCPAEFLDGVAAGPRLLKQGQIVPSTLDYYLKPQPRTAFGLSSNRDKAWIVVVDGRQPGSVGMTGLELSRVLLRLGASDAINLDGGGSSTLVVEGKDGRAKILNRVMQAGVLGMERPVANHLLVFVPHQ